MNQLKLTRHVLERFKLRFLLYIIVYIYIYIYIYIFIIYMMALIIHHQVKYLSLYYIISRDYLINILNYSELVHHNRDYSVYGIWEAYS